MLFNWFAVAIMLFLPAGEQKENPWKAKVAPAVEEATQAGTPASYAAAMDVAWRADDWQTGLQLARAALEKHPDAHKLHARAARAHWRAGHVAEAERLAARLAPKSDDRVALAMLLTVHLARGEKRPAAEAARRLEALPLTTGEDLFYVVGARIALNRLEGLSSLARKAADLADADNGYPEIYAADQLEGLPEFFDAIGSEPVNQLTGYGAAPMPVIPLINLPGCQVMINGHGPYRMIVDTGGSVTVSLDEDVAAQIGLTSLAPASVHGISGKQECGQALVDELKIGGITCRRVLTRTFAVRKAVAFSADGIIGTGLFADGRMTLDFLNGRLMVRPSSEEAGPGTSAELRVVGDAKLMALVSLQGQPAAAMLDTGADAFAVAPSRLASIFPGRKITSIAAPSPAFGVGAEEGPAISLTPGIDFVFAGRKYENFGGLGLDVLDTLLSPMMGIQTDVLAGMPVMREMKSLTVDFPRCRMWVDWLEND